MLHSWLHLWRFVYPAIYASVCLSTYPSIYLPMHPPIHPSIYLFVYPSIYLCNVFIYLSIHLSILSICRSIFIHVIHTYVTYIYSWACIAEREASMVSALRFGEFGPLQHGPHDFQVLHRPYMQMQMSEVPKTIARMVCGTAYHHFCVLGPKPMMMGLPRGFSAWQGGPTS